MHTLRGLCIYPRGICSAFALTSTLQHLNTSTLSMMKALLVYALLILTIACCSAQNSHEQKLLDIEKQRSEAILRHDESFLDELYDDKFQGVTATGQIVNKRKLLEVLSLSNPEVIFSTEEVKAVVYESSGVVTGKLISKSKDGTLLGQSRFMHIYIKNRNEWKIVAGQATVIK